jgi:predicted signal transduction protein with EAL and GGDEF domain
MVSGPFIEQGVEVHLSASIGLVGVGRLHLLFDEMTWLEAADLALYMAKEYGRAQAVVYACEPG